MDDPFLRKNVDPWRLKQKPITWRVAPSGCWLCTSHKSNGGGAPLIRMLPRRQVSIHRFLYEKMYGPIPENKCICHKCDNPMCINPQHWFLGTHSDNMRDKMLKGRAAKKLSLVKVRKMISLRNRGATLKKIAALFDVSNQMVSIATRGICWKHAQNRKEYSRGS